MSTTRSHYPPAPATSPFGSADTGVLLVGHGSSIGAADVLDAHALQVAAAGRYGEVRHATLAGGPDPARQLRAMGQFRRVMVVPMVMSDGHLANRVIPECLDVRDDGREVRICPPLGLAADLIPFARALAEETCRAAGWRARAASLLVAGHGSMRDDASRFATERAAEGLRVASRFDSVTTGYLEQPPRLADAVAALKRPTVVLGYFAGPGVHSQTDVPGALAQAPMPTAYSGAMGSDPRIASVVLAILDREARRSAAA